MQRRGKTRERVVNDLREIHRGVIAENNTHKVETGSIQYHFIFTEIEKRAAKELTYIKPPLTSTQIQNYLYYRKDRKRTKQGSGRERI